MDFAGLSDERAARPVAAHKSNGARDRHARAGRSVVRADSASAAAATADQAQADYFLRVLAQRRRLGEHRIDQYRKAIAISESNGDSEGAANFRRMLCSEEQDRQTLDRLIEKLRRRFEPGAPSEVPAIRRKARVAAR
ncbi:MAG TPA: hypothetical protein VG327_03520 [Mycobacterium sp.]|nr:hypothetical protein [Mycobacterium sp.]